MSSDSEVAYTEDSEVAYTEKVDKIIYGDIARRFDPVEFLQLARAAIDQAMPTYDTPLNKAFELIDAEIINQEEAHAVARTPRDRY